jgi:hypothetical protein
MAQAVSCWPFVAEARVHAWMSPLGVCGGQNLYWDRVFSKFFGVSLSVALHTHVSSGVKQ